MRILVSRAAAADLAAIDDYTIEHFGLAQAIETTERIRKAFQALAELPLSGRVLEDIGPPGRLLRYRTVLGSLLVVYEPTDEGIRVARILHGARNLIAELERDAGDDA